MDGKKSREKEIDEEFESVFRTKVNEEHFMGPYKKTFKVHQELREAAFFKTLE